MDFEKLKELYKELGDNSKEKFIRKLINFIRYNKLSKWLYIGYWRYLLSKPNGRASKWSTFWCRVKGHPCGIVYYTGPSALEPDYSCKNCGDEL